MANEDIKIKISADASGLKSGLKEAESKLKSLDKTTQMAGSGAGSLGTSLRAIAPAAGIAVAGIAAMTAATVGAIAGLYKLSEGVARIGDNLAEAAQRQGGSVEFLSALSHGAELAGISFNELEGGIRNFNRTIAEVLSGDLTERGEAFASLGVEVKDSIGQFRGYEEVFFDIADAFTQIDNEAVKVDAAFKIFGRAGTQLIPLLDEGREGIQAYLDEARNLGNVFDEDLARSSAEFMDSQDRVKGSLQGVKNTIARELMPVFADINNSTAEWISANRELLAQDIQSFLQTIISLGTATVDVLKPIAEAVFGISTAFLKGFNTLAAAPTHFGTFRLETNNTKAAVELLTGAYGPFVDSVKVSEGVYSDASETANQLALALGNMTTEQQKLTQAWVSGKGPLDEYFSSALAWINQINSTPIYFGTTPIAEIQKRQAEIANLTAQASKMGGVFSGEVEPALRKTSLAIGDTTTKYRFFGQEQDVVARSFESAEGLGEAWQNRIVTIGGSTDDTKNKTKSFNDTLTDQIEQLRVQIDTFGMTERELIDYNRAAAIANGGSVALANAVALLSLEFLELKEAIDGVEEFMSDMDKTLADDTKRRLDALGKFSAIELNFFPEPERIREEGKQVLRAIEETVREYPELEESAQALRVLVVQETSRRIAEAERQAYIERLKNSDSFFDQLEGGFLEFADSVENNGELVSQFFANTLTEMSQNFSDFFYNVVTGKFDDLVDVAKSAFDAILRSFLDMVSAIATRQIVISIAGAFGVDTKGAKATDVLGLGKDALGMAGGALGLGGGAAALGSTAGAVAGGGMPLIGMGASPLVAGQIAANAGGGIMASVGAALPYVGAVLAAAALAYTFLGPLLEKTPRIDIDFDSIQTEMGRRAAVVAEFLDDDFFADNIGQVSVKRKAGLGVGGDEKILELIQDRIEETVEGIQGIISRLPSDVYEILNETLLNADIDIETVIGEERLLEFDAKGKKIAEKFQAFIEGELPAKFFASIRESFFDPAFQALGVSGEATQGLIDQFLADMEAAGSREERAVIGQEFLNTFSAFVDAFNIVEGNFGDAIGQALNSVEALSKELGFNAVPSLDEMTVSLREMIKNAEIDPEVLANFVELRNQLLQVKSALADSISGLVDFIDQLNTKIVGLGGAAVDVGYALDEAIASIMQTLQQEDLSLEEREALLRQLDGLVDQWVDGQTAAQAAAWQAQQAAAQEAVKEIAEAQREAVQGQISALEREKEMIAEVGRERLDALNEELQAAQNLFSIAENIGKNIQDLLLGPGGIESPFQRLQRAQAELDSLQGRFAGSSGEERAELATEIQELLNTVLSIGGETFDNTSPEFRDTFRQVINELGSLKDQVEPTKSIEQINQEIADLTKVNEANLRSIDDRLETLRAQAQSIGQEATAASQQGFQLDEATAAEAREYYEYIQQEAQAALEARLEQLAELGIETNGALSAGEAIAAEQLVTLRDIHAALLSSIEGDGQTNIANMVNPATGAVETATGPMNFNPFSPFSVIPAAKGFEGIVNKAQMFLAGEAGPEHVSITPISDLARQAQAGRGHISDLIDRLGPLHTPSMRAGSSLDSGQVKVEIHQPISVDLRGSTFDSKERVQEVKKVLDDFGEKIKREAKAEFASDMVHNMKTRRYLKGGGY